MNNNLPSVHSDFAGAISGRAVPPNVPGMFDHLAGRDAAPYYPPASAPAPAAVGSYRSYTDAILGGLYPGAAAAGLASADHLLPSLSQELRRNHLTLGGFGDLTTSDIGVGVSQHHRHHQPSLLLEERLIQEEKLLRQYDAHNRVLEAELTYRALRDQIAAQNQQQQNQQQQSQQLQNQHLQSEMHLNNSIDRRIVALREHQAQQRLAATASGGVAGEPASLGWVAAQANGGYAHAEQLQLAEEVAAIRERLFHRRVLQHHQGAGSDNAFINPGANSNSLASATSVASNDTLTRLLQLQQLSDEDLIRRATEVRQNSILRKGLELDKRSGTGRSAVDSLLERQILEEHLLRNGGSGGGGIGVGGLTMFNPGGIGSGGIGEGDNDRLHRLDLNLIQRAYADDSLGLRRGLADIGYTTVAAGMTHPQLSNLFPRQQDQHETLRYFKNGAEVDRDGNPLPIANGVSAIPINPISPIVLPQGLTATGNDISRFITAVMKRVPEIGPALTAFLPEGIIASFPHVIDAASRVLRSIQERCARSTDNATCDLHRRITACIALIESNSADLGLGAPVGRPGSALAPQPLMAAVSLLPTGAAMRHAQLFGMGINPNTYQTLPSQNNHQLDLAGGGFVTACGGGMVSYPISGEQLAMAHNYQNQPARVSSDQSRDFPNAGYAPLKENNDVPRHGDVAKSESPVDDNMPMMAMYKSKKKAAMRAMKAEKRKRKPKLVHKVNAPLTNVDPTPKKSLVQKLVQHALFRGGFDPDAVAESNGTLTRKILKCSTKSDPSKDTPIDTPPASPENSDGSSFKPDEAKELTSMEGIKSATVDGESQRAKKRRVANQSNVNVDNEGKKNEDDDSIPIDQENTKGKTNVDIKCGPHGDVLEILSADGVKLSTNNGDANEAESERSAGDETEKETVRNGGSPKTKEVIDKPVESSSGETASKPEDDAVSVLLGLMGK